MPLLSQSGTPDKGNNDMTISNDVLIPLTDLIGSHSLKFSISDISLQSSYFVATVAIIDDFSAYSGVSLYVKVTAKQLCDLVTNSLQKIPLSAELFQDAVLVSQLVSGMAL